MVSGFSQADAQDYAARRARLVAELVEFRPNVVALPALSDRHPDHGSAHVLMRLALADWDASGRSGAVSRADV